MRPRLDEVARSLGRDPGEVVAVADALGLGLLDVNSRLDDRSIAVLRGHFGQPPSVEGTAVDQPAPSVDPPPPIRFVGSLPPVAPSASAPEGAVRLPGSGGTDREVAPPPPLAGPPSPGSGWGPGAGHAGAAAGEGSGGDGPGAGGAAPGLVGSGRPADAPDRAGRRARVLAVLAVLAVVAFAGFALVGGRGSTSRADGVTDVGEFCGRMAFTDDFFARFIAALSVDDIDQVAELGPGVRYALAGAAEASRGAIRADVDTLGEYVEFLIDVGGRPEAWGSPEVVDELGTLDRAVGPAMLRLYADRAEACPGLPGIGG